MLLALFLVMGFSGNKKLKAGVYVILVLHSAFTWSYGVAYMQSPEVKNTIYNMLDLCAKSFVGIMMYIWMYLAKVLVF